jgi:hypothetical protein
VTSQPLTAAQNENYFMEVDEVDVEQAEAQAEAPAEAARVELQHNANKVQCTTCLAWKTRGAGIASHLRAAKCTPADQSA